MFSLPSLNVFARLRALEIHSRKQDISMSTFEDNIDTLGQELTAVSGDVDRLTAKVLDLEGQITAGTVVTPELEAKVQALVDQAKAIDAKTPEDLTTPTDGGTTDPTPLP